MPLKIHDHGQNNTVDVMDGAASAVNGAIVLNGDNNRVSIGLKCRAANISITLGHDCRIEIANNCNLGAVQIVALKNGHLSIGDATAFTWMSRLYLHERGSIRIGANCLIAGRTLMTISDMHSILDRATGERINPAKDIVVEDSVWLAENVSVLKGAVIGSGSAIGLGSVVTGAIPANALAVGVPAKVVKTDIEWKFDMI